jgi:hypothetical protein
MANDKFESFLMAEYANIAKAHFETGKQVSTFFNYYLLVSAAPVIIVSLIQNKKIDLIINPLQDNDAISLHWLIIFILSIISLIGFGLCWIVIGLQHDSIIYARTVNGIRNYFYREANLPTNIEQATRVLPKDTKRPDFFSYRHLGIIVATFSLVNASFAAAAFYIFEKGNLPCLLIVGLLLYALTYFIVHYILSNSRTKKYSNP